MINAAKYGYEAVFLGVLMEKRRHSNFCHRIFGLHWSDLQDVQDDLILYVLTFPEQ